MRVARPQGPWAKTPEMVALPIGKAHSYIWRDRIIFEQESWLNRASTICLRFRKGSPPRGSAKRKDTPAHTSFSWQWRSSLWYWESTRTSFLVLEIQETSQ